MIQFGDFEIRAQIFGGKDRFTPTIMEIKKCVTSGLRMATE